MDQQHWFTGQLVRIAAFLDSAQAKESVASESAF